MPRDHDLLVIDLDGTLLGCDGTVSDANRAALHDARAAGFDLIIATGRALAETRHLLDDIEHDGVVITAGGSMLHHAGTGRTLQRHALPLHVSERVVKALVAADIAALLLKDAGSAGYDYLAVGRCDLHPVSEWWFGMLGIEPRRVATLDDDPHPELTVRAAAIGDAESLVPIAAVLRDLIGDEMAMNCWSAVSESHATGSDIHLLEVFDSHVNKWSTLEQHCRTEGVDPRRIIAIGDGVNDIEMLRHAGFSIAMENANDAVRAEADHLAGHHDEDGVAEVIAALLDGRLPATAG